MPKRKYKRKNNREPYLSILKDRDTAACLLCGKVPTRSRDLTIDHLDGNTRNNRLDNLHLLCRSCNAAEGNRARSGTRLLTTETAPALRARMLQNTPTISRVPPVCVRDPGPILPIIAQGSSCRPGAFGSPEDANQLMEPLYRLWVFEQVKAHGSIRKEDALSGGAEYLQLVVGRGSPFTLERYLRKLISCVGSFTEYRSELGGLEYGFRPGVDVEALGDRLRSEAKFMGPSRSCDESFRTSHTRVHTRGGYPPTPHAHPNTSRQGHAQGRDGSFENMPACAREGGVGKSPMSVKDKTTNTEGVLHAE